MKFYSQHKHFIRALLLAGIAMLSACVAPVKLPSIPVSGVYGAVKATAGAAKAVVSSVSQAALPALNGGFVPGLTLPPLFETREVLALNLSQETARRLQGLGFVVAQQMRYEHLGLHVWRLRIPASAAMADALALLTRRDPDGDYSSNQIYRLSAAQPVCPGTRCYGQKLIGAADRSCSGQVAIGMIDSAVAMQNQAILGQRVFQRRHDPAGRTSPADHHGTAIAALLIGGAGSDFPGMLSRSDLYAADVFSFDEQNQPYTDVTAIIDALDWLLANKVKLINMSFSGPHSELLAAAIQRAEQAGVLMVAAAGNLGPSAPAQYPAAYPEVLAITAVDRNLRLYEQAVTGAQIDLAAPGVSIWTTDRNGSGDFRAGTSFAAPFAAAAAARVWAAHPQWQAAQVRQHLQQQAIDLGARGRDQRFGHGLVRAPACAAVQSL